jgi:hypothetical protein
MRTVFAVMPAVLSATAPTGARVSNSANSKMEGCRAAIKRSTPQGPMAMAVGYCLGMIDGLVFGSHGASCLPAAVTTEQRVRVVVTYIDARPARMHEDFRKLAREAFVDAWPCKR